MSRVSLLLQPSCPGLSAQGWNEGRGGLCKYVTQLRRRRTPVTWPTGGSDTEESIHRLRFPVLVFFFLNAIHHNPRPWASTLAYLNPSSRRRLERRRRVEPSCCSQRSASWVKQHVS